MPQVTSRVNGLKITIPSDARNIVHRFAISGGGNELVFEPLTRKTFNSSKQSDKDPMAIGAAGADHEIEGATVELSENVVDDEPAQDEVKADAKPAKKTTRAPRKAASKTEATTEAETIL